MSKIKLEEMMVRVRTGHNVVVMRGVSGSGKSTAAKKLLEAMPEGAMKRIFSADEQFIGEDGIYRFDPKQLAHAYACCLRRFLDHVLLMAKLKEPPESALLIVDNTNTTMHEAAPYMQLAYSFAWTPYLLTMNTDWRKAVERNVHGVPFETVMAQQYRMEGERAYLQSSWWRQYSVEDCS